MDRASWFHLRCGIWFRFSIIGLCVTEKPLDLVDRHHDPTKGMDHFHPAGINLPVSPNGLTTKKGCEFVGADRCSFEQGDFDLLFGPMTIRLRTFMYFARDRN